MKRTLWTVCAVAWLAACSAPAPSVPDGGNDAGDFLEDLEITVSGTVSVHPEAVRYLQATGQPVPGIEGLTLRVEEPLKAALNDPTALFGELKLTTDGKFSVSKVPVAGVNLGIAGGIRDEADAGSCAPDAGTADAGSCGRRMIRSATGIYDVAIESRKPEKDIVDAKVYAVPLAFHEKLTAAVGEATIRQLNGNAKKTLLEAGFLLGRVVDAQGNPVAGVKITPTQSAFSAQLFYPTADLSGTQASTSSTGLFVFVHNAADVATFKFNIEGRSEYLTRNAGAARDTCLVVTVYPGKTAP